MSNLTHSPRHLPATQTQQLMALGRRYGWRFAHLGNAPLPDAAIHVGQWWLVPAQQDTKPLPTHATQRIQAVYRSGLRPAGWVVAHEAPHLLAAPNQATVAKPAIWPYLAALGGLGWLLASTIATVAIIDPILIAITDDNDWVEIDRWVD